MQNINPNKWIAQEQIVSRNKRENYGLQLT